MWETKLQKMKQISLSYLPSSISLKKEMQRLLTVGSKSNNISLLTERACSSVDRAHGYEPWCRGFDSLQAQKNSFIEKIHNCVILFPLD